MVPAIAIAVLFTTLAALIAYTAATHGFGRVSDVLHTGTPVGRRLMSAGLVVAYVGFGVAAPLIFIIGNAAKSNAQVGGVRLTAQEQVGRELFNEHCAVCHTLAATNAVGKIGPNLDVLKPPESLVLHTIANGCLQKPTSPTSAQSCLGFGTMPADVVQGPQAIDVAKFVAAVAGHV